MGRALLQGWRERAKALTREVAALALAARDPRTPWAARLLVLAIVAYAVSPIDLIPDFIPVLGMLDDIILLPAAIIVAIRMIPSEVMADARARSDQLSLTPSRTAAVVMVLLWALALGCLVVWLWPGLIG